ncbi:MAG: extracellular solute-binding protein [Oscillospiraceae bacterium]|jgi:putative aldouronate transport system substrate-binding protein|nr:extracellular solute-binding protein [Oscillospiraceae bacterium]
MKRTLALLTALVMAATWCTTAAMADGDAVAWIKYDPPIEMSFGGWDDVNGSEAAAMEKAFGETFENNRWTDYFLEEVGVKVVYDLLDPVDYNQSLLLAMATGDLPDYFKINNYGNLRSMVEAGLIAEMGPLYEQYASPLMKAIMESEGEMVFVPGTFDGKLYGLPAKMPSTNSYVHLFVRQDWLDKLGLDRPTTMDDVYEVAKAFKTQDPDGNGADDTIGLAMDNNFLYQAAGVFWAFGAYPNGTQWIERDGKLAYATVQPEIKDGLAWYKKMYDEGLIDQEFGSKKYDKGYEEPVMNGKCGLMYGKHWNAYVLGQQMGEDPDSKWVSIPLPVGTVEEILIPANVAMDYLTVATVEAQNPEGIIHLANAYVDKLFGENDDFDHFFADGDVAGIWSKSPFFLLDPMVDLQGYRDIQSAYDTGTLDQLAGPGRGFYNFYLGGSYYYWLMFGAGDSCFRYVDQTYPDKLLWNNYVGAPTPTMIERWTNMDELLVTSYTRMIQGQQPLEDFDSVIAQWYSMGGNEVTAEINELRGYN